MSVTFVTRPDMRRQKENGTYPIKMWVMFKRKSKSYQTVFETTAADFEKLYSPNTKGAIKQLRENLKDLNISAELYLKEIDDFSFDEFEKGFVLNNPAFKERKIKVVIKEHESSKTFDYSIYEKRFVIFKETHPYPDSISFMFQTYVKRLLRIGKIGSAVHYQTAYHSFKKFRGNVRFADVTVDYLAEYQYWLLQQNKSKTTVGMYARNMRTMYNEAIEANLAKRKNYPFGRRKYIIPASRNIKKALTGEDLKKIYCYQTDCPKKSKARDMWLFMYFGNGMNPKDVALLKYKNIDEGYITFERSKVERTSASDAKQITFYITEDIQRIINTWGNVYKSTDTYLFPILEEGLNPLTESFKIDYFIATTNKWMREVFKELGIQKKSSTIVSRHTVATHLKFAGASKEYIQESLGHSSIKTTENYLDSFEREIKKEFAERLSSIFK
ncbi:tyrosine-type recombinase/integrase [Parafilimonas sp.]|uniref:tyrosine-type recombinase/integrase n=1 Tax=Parafilimonas sp. TaxID=1969739 RepID=UPI003F7FE29D